jgi:hypothetical protein
LGSEAPNTFARKVAEWILLQTPRIRIPDRVAASAQGGIGIFFYDGHKYADIECFNTGEILGTIATGDQEPHIWEFPVSEIKTALDRIGNYLATGLSA